MFLVAMACLLPAGCGPAGPKERPTAPVSGTVTLDGQPLADGEIYFVKADEGINEILPIKDGKFSGKASLGDRKVEIRSYKEVKANTEMYGADAPVTKQDVIPAKYNAESTLKATIAAGGSTPLEFAVTSK
jgi:hypothetical protein